MKTKVALVVLMFCGVTTSSCNLRAAPEPGLTQVPAQPSITATLAPDDILTETSFFPPLSPTAPVTLEPNNPEAEFILATANQVPPEAIVEEITYFGAGAALCSDPPYPEPVIVFYPEDQELMIQTSLTSCGWAEGEILTATVQYPDGRLEQWSLPAELDSTGFYFARLDFQPSLEDPTGTYIYTLEGSSGSLTAEAQYRMPDGPRLFSTSDGQLLLYGFAPGESVAVYCYDSIGGLNSEGAFVGELLGWQEYVIDENGQLMIDAPVDQCHFAAIGSLTGEVHLLTYELNAGIAYDWYPDGIQRPNCGGLPSRLIGGTEARVAFTDGSNMRIRAQPGFSADILTSVPEGTILFLHEHVCVDTSVWWRVVTDGGQEGWITEEQNGVYLLEPAN
jgi:hypothetical protein